MFLDSVSGQWYTFSKKNIYYLDGDNIVSSNTANISDGNTQYGILRNTEYKWGEIVFVSKPDSVENLKYDSTSQSITWTKPADEGYGTTDGKTNTDDYIKINEYVVRIKDKDGNVVYTKTLPRTDDDTVTLVLNNIYLKNAVYTAEITAKNVINESDPQKVTFDLRMPESELTVTPSQTTYELEDTVIFTEDIKNIGRVPLTNVIVTQSVAGKYTSKDGVKINGAAAQIETLDVGQRVQLEYKTPASAETNNIIKNTAKVTVNEGISDTFTSTVTVIKPGLSAVTTADKSTYIDGDTVLLTTVVTNTGNETINNILVSHNIDSGEFQEPDNDKTTVADSNNTIIINKLTEGESITLTYAVSANEIKTGKNAVADIVTTAKTADGELTAASIPDFCVFRSALSLNITPNEELLDYDDDVLYTLEIINNGNCTLNNITVTSNTNGIFDENDAGVINDTGDFFIKELAEGKSVILVYSIESKNTSYGKLTNTFTADYTSDDNITNSTSKSIDAEIVNYNLDLQKLIYDNEHYIGEDVMFRCVVTNKGNHELKNVIVKEEQDGRFELSDGAITSGKNSIVISSILPGKSYYYDFYVTAAKDKVANGKLSSTAFATAGDNITASDTESVTVYSPMFTVEKTVDSNTIYNIGDEVEWTDKITNTGDCDLTNIKLTETLNGTFVTDYQTDGNSVVIPVLKQGESAEIKFITKVQPGDLSNSRYICKVKITTAENISGSAFSEVKVTGPAIKITKYSNKEIYYPGDLIIFTEAIINEGDKKLTNVVVTEDLDGEFIELGDNFIANEKTVTIPEIDVGESVVVRYSVERMAGAGTEVTSSVTATCDQKVFDTSTLIVKLEKEEITNTDSELKDTDSENIVTDTQVDSAVDTMTDDTETDTTSDNNETDTTSDVTETDTTSDVTKTDTTSDVTETDTTSDVTETDTTSDDTETDTLKEIEDMPIKLKMGDVDMDGKVSARDSLLIQRYTIGLTYFNDAQLFLADVSNDNKVSATDALVVLRYTINLKTDSITDQMVDLPSSLKQYIPQ